MTNDEIKEAYRVAELPYLQGQCAVDWSKYIHMRSWRYVLEISSMCNLKCALCHAGNREGYEYKPGIMDMELLEKILDKIKEENPEATVCAYVNSDPFLHPRLADCIASIKRRGLKCEIATNGNYISNIEEVLATQPDLFTVSLSGWTQAVYERAHRYGDIELVKSNIQKLADCYYKAGYKFPFGISYHLYKDNLHEVEPARAFAQSMGMMFLTSWGRAICIENTVQALRELERRKTGSVAPYEKGPGDQDMNTMLPPAKEDFIQSMERLHFHPERCYEFYDKFPVSPICLMADLFTEIRWDGRVQLCAWTDDMRLTMGNFLDLTPEQRAELRRGHPLCKECLRYRLNLYFHIVEGNKW